MRPCTSARASAAIGVSLVQNFRSQAQEIVSAEGPDGLIQKLRDKQIQSPRAKKA